MATTTSKRDDGEPEATLPDPGLFELLPSWELSIRARRLSPNTLSTYTDGVRSLHKWCVEHGEPFGLSKQLVLTYLVDCLEDRGLAASTMDSYLKAIKIFAKWCLAEGELDANELADVQPPKADEVILPAVTAEQWDAMIATCEANLRGKRDRAILGLLRDTGARANELVAVNVGDVNQREQSIVLHGKGGRDRIGCYSDRTALHLDQYLRERRKSKYAVDNPVLLLSVSGPRLRYMGLYEMLRRRAARAGLEAVSPHMFRRMWANEGLDNGLAPSDLKPLGGWRSYAMVEHYTKQNQAKRAIKAQRSAFEARDR